jgi:hypothetical protein
MTKFMKFEFMNHTTGFEFFTYKKNERNFRIMVYWGHEIVHSSNRQ